MRRALLACLVLAAFPAQAQAATTVKRYSAWNDNGDPTVKRYSHGSGECENASRVSSRANAWRCTSGNTTFDPCFATPTEDEEVLCVGSPWAKQGQLLSVLLDPETHGSSPAPDVWALVVGRRRCTYIAGRTRGKTYRCGKRRFLFGKPNRRKKTWTIKVGKNRRTARRARIRVAWT